ncbi:MAG: mitochondrial import inner membrane translocase subunit tim54 [Vezdaea aestivalis]|nr:MAG: mitochondrial import inner membrane translocase subunit tim54 [Vezdaea aestivalis]
MEPREGAQPPGQSSQSAPVKGSTAAMAEVAPKRNPAFQAMGLPRWKLPSRNWMIFLSITGAITSLSLYDRREKRKNQEKWCKVVSHIAREPMSTKDMPRKLSIFLSAPPADGLRASREHFREYVKPILNAAAIDWEIIEGRKEGDIRLRVAERIRDHRMKAEESSPGEEDMLLQIRKSHGVKEYEGVKGDVVIGRHTWKEYIRGLHEGWLGPLHHPQQAQAGVQADTPSNTTAPVGTIDEGEDSKAESELQQTSLVQDSPLVQESPQSEERPQLQSDENKATDERLPFLATSEYETSSSAPSIPAVFEPSIAIPHFHILGFLNTPIRIYNFFNRRSLADQIGRETAAIVLAASRPYGQSAHSSIERRKGNSSASSTAAEFAPDESYVDGQHEQTGELANEERNWHKSVRERKTEEERVWLDDTVLDPRIAAKMRKFALTEVDEVRAEDIKKGVPTKDDGQKE